MYHTTQLYGKSNRRKKKTNNRKEFHVQILQMKLTIKTIYLVISKFYET